MILKMFHSQYFKSLAICPNSKVVDGHFPYDLVWVVGRFEIFTRMRGSGLKLFGFGNKFLPKGK